MLKLVEDCDSLLYDQPQLSLDFAERANLYANELENDSLIAITLNRIGSAHWSLGNQMAALEKIQESLQLSESNRYQEIGAKNLGNIGDIYAASGLDLDAIGYYKSELDIQKKVNNRFRLFTVNNSLGQAFLGLNNYDSAHFYLDQASNYLDKEFEHLHSIFFFNQAELNFKEGKTLEADSLINLTYQSSTNFDSRRGKVRANQLRAELYRSNGKLEQALNHARIAFDLADQSGVKELIYITSKTLSNCYGELGRYKQAFEKQKLHELYMDSVRNVSIINELELLSYYQRLFRMRVLESKNTTNKEMAEQRQMVIYGLIIILLIAAIMISVIIRRGKKIRKQKRKLEELDVFKSKIFAIVSHDLKSPIQSVSSVIELFNKKLISKEEIEPFLPEVKEKTSNLMNLLNNVFQWAEGQMVGENLSKDIFSLTQVISDLKSELNDRLKEKNIKLSFDKSKEYQLESNGGIVRILLRNLIVNAIKFSQRDSEIRINIIEGKLQTVLEVIDQGVGMNEEMCKRIFNGGLTSTIGTEGEKGNGLGLALCSDFVKGLGGKIEVESEVGKGSIFRVTLKDSSSGQ
ncbi:tetratricopeptide repeat-containing sensor histidine kinase [Ekhidna sp.]